MAFRSALSSSRYDRSPSPPRASARPPASRESLTSSSAPATTTTQEVFQLSRLGVSALLASLEELPSDKHHLYLTMFNTTPENQGGASYPWMMISYPSSYKIAILDLEGQTSLLDVRGGERRLSLRDIFYSESWQKFTVSYEDMQRLLWVTGERSCRNLIVLRYEDDLTRNGDVRYYGVPPSQRSEYTWEILPDFDVMVRRHEEVMAKRVSRKIAEDASPALRKHLAITGLLNIVWSKAEPYQREKIRSRCDMMMGLIDGTSARPGPMDSYSGTGQGSQRSQSAVRYRNNGNTRDRNGSDDSDDARRMAYLNAGPTVDGFERQENSTRYRNLDPSTRADDRPSLRNFSQDAYERPHDRSSFVTREPPSRYCNRDREREPDRDRERDAATSGRNSTVGYSSPSRDSGLADRRRPGSNAPTASRSPVSVKKTYVSPTLRERSLEGHSRYERESVGSGAAYEREPAVGTGYYDREGDNRSRLHDEVVSERMPTTPNMSVSSHQAKGHRLSPFRSPADFSRPDPASHDDAPLIELDRDDPPPDSYGMGLAPPKSVSCHSQSVREAQPAATRVAPPTSGASPAILATTVGGAPQWRKYDVLMSTKKSGLLDLGEEMVAGKAGEVHHMKSGDDIYDMRIHTVEEDVSDTVKEGQGKSTGLENIMLAFQVSSPCPLSFDVQVDTNGGLVFHVAPKRRC